MGTACGGEYSCGGDVTPPVDEEICTVRLECVWSLISSYSVDMDDIVLHQSFHPQSQTADERSEQGPGQAERKHVDENSE